MRLWSLIEWLTADWKHLARFSVLALAISSCLWLIAVGGVLTVSWLAPGTDIKVEKSGAIILSTRFHKTTAVYLLTPHGAKAGPWVNTGIEIKRGQDVRITASGRVCLAMHHMVESGIKDVPPPLPWSGPSGLDPCSALPPTTPRDEELVRSKYLICNTADQGELIGVISAGEPPIKPDSVDVLEIGDYWDQPAKKSGTLWLTVNEIWLNKSLADAYAPKTPEEFEKNIVANSYWNVWYDDNAGAFLITVEL